jgi:hypothetical protein
MEKKYGWCIGSMEGFSLWKIRDEEILSINSNTYSYIQLDINEYPDDYDALIRRGVRYFNLLEIEVLKQEIYTKTERLHKLQQEVL